MAGEKLEVVEVDGFEIRLEPHQVAYSIACWAGGFMLIVIIVLVIILFQRLIKRRNDKKNKTEIDIEEIDTGIRSNTSTGTDPNTNFIISKNEKSQEALTCDDIPMAAYGGPPPQQQTQFFDARTVNF